MAPAERRIPSGRLRRDFEGFAFNTGREANS